MKRILLSAFLCISFLSPSFACQYIAWDIPFFDGVKRDDSMIARGKVVEKTDTYLVVELIEVYRGDETRCQIKIYNGGDYNCTGTVFDYELLYFGEVGQTLLFHADEITSELYGPEAIGEYRNMYARVGKSNILMHPIIQEGNTLKGDFTEGVTSLKVNEVAKRLADFGVQRLLPLSRPLCGSHTLSIYPNPSLDYFSIKTNIEEEAELLVYNTTGQLVLRKEAVAREEKILLDNLASGLYLVFVKTARATFQQKLVIN